MMLAFKYQLHKNGIISVSDSSSKKGLTNKRMRRDDYTNTVCVFVAAFAS